MNIETPTAPTRARSVKTFARVLVGVDGSPEALEAARQASALAEGPLTVVSAYNPQAGLAVAAGPAIPAYLDEQPLRVAAEEAVATTVQTLADRPVVTKIGRGRPANALLEETRSGGCTLVVAGSHGHRRPVGIVIGSTATELIHKAPCSVLVTRASLGRFPGRIVVGVDGSDESLAAYEVAKELAGRFDAQLVAVAASVGDHDRERISSAVDEVRWISDGAVAALTTASADADLVVVGSRGLQGLKAIGSVSEQVAHEAASSVLVVRGR